MNIGFSTGSLAYSDFQRAINMLIDSSANVIELSALRESELETLINSMDDLKLDHFDYVSFHAPSKIAIYSEDQLVFHLKKIAARHINIILHPDVIQNISLWKSLGTYLCIENMDKRKWKGRTSSDLEEIFDNLPEASFCFDLAHVRQVDPTMSEALIMIKKFGSRLKQLHVSDVNSKSIHEPLNLEAIVSFRKIAGLINHNIPIVLESPVAKDKIEQEMLFASLIFDDNKFQEFINSIGIGINSYTGRLQSLVSTI